MPESSKKSFEETIFILDQLGKKDIPVARHATIVNILRIWYKQPSPELRFLWSLWEKWAESAIPN